MKVQPIRRGKLYLYHVYLYLEQLRYHLGGDAIVFLKFSNYFMHCFYAFMYLFRYLFILTAAMMFAFLFPCFCSTN